MAFKDSDANWPEIERIYREGFLPVNQLARDFGITEGAIRARAKKHKWIRDETGAARQAAIDSANARLMPNYISTPAERVAEIGAIAGEIIHSHRRDAAMLRDMLRTMGAEFMKIQEDRPMLEDRLIEYYEMKAAGNPLMAAFYRTQMQQALHALSIGSQSKTLLNMANTMDKLVNIERKSWNLDEENDGRSYEDVLAEVYAKALNSRVVATQQKRVAQAA